MTKPSVVSFLSSVNFTIQTLLRFVRLLVSQFRLLSRLSVCLTFVTLVHATKRAEFVYNILAPTYSMALVLGGDDNSQRCCPRGCYVQVDMENHDL